MIVKSHEADRYVASPPKGLTLALVYGPDAGLVQERAEKLLKSVVPDLTDAFNVADLSESTLLADPARLADEAAAISMMGGRRVVRVRGAGNDLAELLESFADDPRGDALVVIEAGDLAKTSALRKIFDAHKTAAAVQCYPDSVRDLGDVVRDALRAEGLSSAPDALEGAVSRLGSDRGVTRREIEKLLLYMHGKKQVTLEDVRAVMGDEAEARSESAAPTLCDSASAVRWTEQASRYGVPFLVALPTYGYLAVMDDAGKLTGLIAESDASALETGSRVREVSARPSAIAELVAHWMGARPQAMRGVIWYRMPVDGDRLNWSWPTLARVMRGAVPIGQLVLRCEESSAGLFELVAANDGDADATLPKSLLAQWSADVALVGADGLAGMEWSRKSANQAAFARVIEGPDARIRPGERRVIGWIRLDKHTEVSVHAVEEP